MTTLSLNITGCTISESSSYNPGSIDSSLYGDYRFFYGKNEEDDGTYSVGDNTIQDADVTLPKYTPEGYPITKIGDFGFNSYIQRLTIPSFIEGFIYDQNFRNCSKLETVNILSDKIEVIPFESFFDCKSLKHINFPNSIKKINRRAFWGCESLESIKLPDQLEILEERVFTNCPLINQITFPNTLKIINSTFISNRGLTEITIPGSVEKMTNSFQGCINITKIILEDGVKEIHEKTFAETSIKKIFLPKSVKMYSDCAFHNCPKDLVIYCEADTQPEDWWLDWNSDEHQVIWGAKRSDLNE